MGSTHEAKITILTFVALLEGKGRKLGAMPNLPPLWSLGRVESVAARITSPVCGGGRRGGRRPPLGPPPLPQKLGVEVWMPLCVLAETQWGLDVILWGGWGCFLAGGGVNVGELKPLLHILLGHRGRDL